MPGIIYYISGANIRKITEISKQKRKNMHKEQKPSSEKTSQRAYFRGGGGLLGTMIDTD